MNEKISYIGEVLYQFMMAVLTKYDIQNRILSITRDNAGPMNVLVSEYKENLGGLGTDFDGGIRCVEHILNLSTEALLHYTLLKTNGTNKFDRSMKAILEENPLIQDSADRMNPLPRVMRLIILQINYSHKMKNIFRTLVAAKKARGSSNTGPEKILRDNDTRWLSTYRMIDRFIHFREEIMTALKLKHGDFVESSADLEKFQLTSQDWNYLEALRDVLEIFRAPTLILQASSYPTINQTIPLVCGVSHELSSAKEKDTLIANHLIAFSLEKGRKKLLEYYPVDDKNCMENKMLYVAIVLDPRYKLAIFENVGFSAEKISGIKSAFSQVYSDCQKDEENATVDESALADSVTSVVSNGSGWLFLDEIATEGNSDELGVYFRDPRESKSMDVLAFYKIHQKRFPIISRIARDYFAVPAMSTPSEALFSRV